VPALRRRGRYGLAFIDCHADFWQPDDEPNGQAASLDLALATGRGPELLANLDGLGPLVHNEYVALVGYRAFGDNEHFHEEHVRDTAITVLDLLEIQRRGSEHAVDRATETLENANGVHAGVATAASWSARDEDERVTPEE
jgi:arginase